MRNKPRKGEPYCERHNEFWRHCGKACAEGCR